MTRNNGDLTFTDITDAAGLLPAEPPTMFTMTGRPVSVFDETLRDVAGNESRAMIWNDVACGVVALVFAGLALGRKRGWASWANAAVGVWLLAAPLIFWRRSRPRTSTTRSSARSSSRSGS